MPSLLSRTEKAPILDNPINEHHEPVEVLSEKQFNTYHTFKANDVVVQFQCGPIKECGVNGLHNEHLLAMVAQRLADFQESPFACEENGRALRHVNLALEALLSRTERRKQEGVEGTHKLDRKAEDIAFLAEVPLVESYDPGQFEYLAISHLYLSSFSLDEALASMGWKRDEIIGQLPIIISDARRLVRKKKPTPPNDNEELTRSA